MALQVEVMLTSDELELEIYERNGINQQLKWLTQ